VRVDSKGLPETDKAVVQEVYQGGEDRTEYTINIFALDHTPRPIAVYSQCSFTSRSNRKRASERFVVGYEVALQLVETPKSE